MSGYATLSQLCSTASENRFIKMLLDVARAIRHRWRVLRFGRRFYDQVCGTQSAVLDSPCTVPIQDFSEHLFRRSVPPRIHDLVQLRVASQITSAAQTKLRADLCRERGWSSEQIGAALLGTKSRCFSEPEALLLQYAADMTRTPIDVDPQVIRETPGVLHGGGTGGADGLDSIRKLTRPLCGGECEVAVEAQCRSTAVIHLFISPAAL